MNEIETSKRVKTENQIMELIQEFASSWSLVGGRYDDGSMLENSNNLKQEIRSAYESLKKENERLTKCLISANTNHEQFERKYYLELDKVEDLQAVNATQAKRIDELMNRDVKELSWDDAENLAENALIAYALTAFSCDSTNKNAVGLIRYIVCAYNKIVR